VTRNYVKRFSSAIAATAGPAERAVLPWGKIRSTVCTYSDPRRKIELDPEEVTRTSDGCRMMKILLSNP